MQECSLLESGPYLITVRKLDYQHVYDTIMDRLGRCDSLRRLEPSHQALTKVVKNSLNAATNGERRPIKFDTLQSYNAELYQSLRLGGSVKDKWDHPLMMMTTTIGIMKVST